MVSGAGRTQLHAEHHFPKIKLDRSVAVGYNDGERSFTQGGVRMADTKENILHTALRLFARNGYEATSVGDIAGALAMTKGALYKHYRNKQDIFDSIVERLGQMDREQARTHGTPEETFDQAPQTFAGTSIEQMVNFMEGQFRFLTENEFVSHARNMLTLEQYRNPAMAELYQKWLVSGPVDYMEDLIREMMRRGIWKPGDPKILALELYAPFYLLLSMADAGADKTKPIHLLMAHVRRFVERNAAAPSREWQETWTLENT